jgi:glycerophosphoryl diester phosphodiesterase
LSDCALAGLSSALHPLIDFPLGQRLSTAKKEIPVWMVDFLAAARHYQPLGVDSLLSNRPGVLRQGLFAETT